MGKKTFIVCLVFTLVSVWFLIMAFLTFPLAETFTETKVSYGPQGFMFGTSEELNSSNSEFKIALGDFEFEKGKINCSVIVHPFVRNVSNDEYVFFLLQIPHKIGNVKVTYEAWQPNSTSFPAENTSYILVEIPRANFTFEEAKFCRFDFEINHAISKIDYYTYETILTFETGFHHFGREKSALANIARNIDEMYFFQVVRAFLHVERPESYEFSQMLPLPELPDFWEGEPSFRWDVKSLSSLKTAFSIILRVEDLSSKNLFNWRYSLSFLFLGIGIPLLFSSAFETYKNKDIKLKDLLNYVWFWIILIILIVVLLFISYTIHLWLKINTNLINMVEMTNMFSSEQLLFIAATIAIGFILYYIFNFAWRLERKNDVRFFLFGDMIFMIFLVLFIVFPEQVPDLISSLFIAELTLALVWVELSKRPELKLADFVPIIWKKKRRGERE